MTKSNKCITAIAVLIISCLSYQLGWSMRGDKIFSNMYSGTFQPLPDVSRK